MVRHSLLLLCLPVSFPLGASNMLRLCCRTLLGLICGFCRGNDASQLCPHFHDFVLCGSHILQNREEGSLDTIIKDLVEVSGNGTMLILGYKVPQHAPEIETEFREVFCKYFDLRNGRQVIYEMPDGDVVIMYVRRKPYSSFFEKFSFCPHRA